MSQFVISVSYGPTDPTRAMLPFAFASAALQAGDQVTLMLLHDAVLMAPEGAAKQIVPVGPPNRFEQVVGEENATVLVCEACAVARGISEQAIDGRLRMAGMHEFYAAAAEDGAKVVSF